jgi:hypothetical protein
VAKSIMVQIGKPGCIASLGGLPVLGYHLKILCTNFSLLFNEKQDNWTQLCLDLANNLFKSIQIVHT